MTDRSRIIVFAGSRSKAEDWLSQRNVRLDAVLLVIHADDMNFTMAGMAFDLTGFIFASGPLRRAMRRDRFCWLTEAEFLVETRS
ncbi:MAG: hypothetical protein ACK4X1_16375 [Terricaulis sp.]